MQFQVCLLQNWNTTIKMKTDKDSVNYTVGYKLLLMALQCLKKSLLFKCEVDEQHHLLKAELCQPLPTGYTPCSQRIS